MYPTPSPSLPPNPNHSPPRPSLRDYQTDLYPQTLLRIPPTPPSSESYNSSFPTAWGLRDMKEVLLIPHGNSRQASHPQNLTDLQNSANFRQVIYLHFSLHSHFLPSLCSHSDLVAPLQFLNMSSPVPQTSLSLPCPARSPPEGAALLRLLTSRAHCHQGQGELPLPSLLLGVKLSIHFPDNWCGWS